MKELAIVVRATKENTLKTLLYQLDKQKLNHEPVIVLDQAIPFEEKLKQSLINAVELGKESTLVIDADILVRSNFLKKARIYSERLSYNDLGMGFKVFDFFYNQPKYRGIHLYNTKNIKKILSFFPLPDNVLRPETHLKEFGKRKFDLSWHTNVNYVAGIHDFFQSYEDIAYKYFVRYFRSSDDIELLIAKFKKEKKREYEYAQLGLELAMKNQFQSNNKQEFFERFSFELNNTKNDKESPKENIDYLLFNLLFKHYGFSKRLLNSLL